MNLKTLERIKKARRPFLWIGFYDNLRKTRIINRIKKYFGPKPIVRLFNDKYMMIDFEDVGLSRDIFFAGIREPRMTHYLLDKFLKERCYEVFLDIGANIGYYTVVLSDYFPKIIAIEPVSQNYEILMQNISLNSLKDKVVGIKAAVGDNNSKMEIIVPQSRNTASMMQINAEGQKETVQMKTLDSLIDMKFGGRLFLKMDLEGYEYFLIDGNRNFFSDYKVDIFMELHPDIIGKKRAIKIINVLGELNYEIETSFFEIRGINYLAQSRFATRIDKFLNKKFNQDYENRGIRMSDYVPFKSLQCMLEDEKFLNGKKGAVELLLVRS